MDRKCYETNLSCRIAYCQPWSGNGTEKLKLAAVHNFSKRDSINQERLTSSHKHQQAQRRRTILLLLIASWQTGFCSVAATA